MTEVSGLAEPVITPGTASTPVSGSNNQLASWTHDANGNVISDGVFTYTWDALNRLVQVEENANIIASYAYDSQNRRISKTVGANTTHYIYDLNSQLIAETLADGTPLRDYFYLEGQPLAVREYQNTPGLYYFLNDHLGTPQQLITPSGTVVWQAAYLPYGEAQVITETVHNNLRFPGQYFDAETGLQYNWNRYYDPETGRYISADPIGLEGGLNLYAYVGGNPINWTDPEGLMVPPPPPIVLPPGAPPVMWPPVTPNTTPMVGVPSPPPVKPPNFNPSRWDRFRLCVEACKAGLNKLTKCPPPLGSVPCTVLCVPILFGPGDGGTPGSHD